MNIKLGFIVSDHDKVRSTNPTNTVYNNIEYSPILFQTMIRFILETPLSDAMPPVTILSIRILREAET